MTGGGTNRSEKWDGEPTGARLIFGLGVAIFSRPGLGEGWRVTRTLTIEREN